MDVSIRKYHMRLLTLHSRSNRSSILKSEAHRVQIHLSNSSTLTLTSVQHLVKYLRACSDFQIYICVTINLEFDSSCIYTNSREYLCYKGKSLAYGVSYVIVLNHIYVIVCLVEFNTI